MDNLLTRWDDIAEDHPVPLLHRRLIMGDQELVAHDQAAVEQRNGMIFSDVIPAGEEVVHPASLAGLGDRSFRPDRTYRRQSTSRGLVRRSSSRLPERLPRGRR